MRIVSFDIENFRGIRRAHAANLGSTVIIAGQNGSGKSCIFDAIRLVKSVYGGYQQNEWHHWMGEFAINVNSPSQDITGLFNDKRSRVSLLFNFELHDKEKIFLTSNVDEILTEAVWRSILPEAYSYGGYRLALFAAQFRQREQEVRQKVDQLKPKFFAELSNDYVTASVTIDPGSRINLRPSEVLSVIFMLYRPREIGLIDYHGPQRHYGRELVQNVNISLDSQNQVQGANALYNYSSKYQNVKSEMAASYMREILAEQAGVERASQSTLTNTLRELFETFFPNKTFLGPVPTLEGGLSFPVQTALGRHDLDDLSSGEKEILYGYLRIRNSAPRFSIILIDEPELHLNPRLVKGLPQFYWKNLGIALDNQIWLVTHSDALLREAFGNSDFKVFHMQPCTLLDQSGTVTSGYQQLKLLDVSSDINLALADLVGDLAAYQPDGRVVIFEGGGDTDFDVWMTSTLFQDFASSVNLISGSNKNKVKALHEVLNRANSQGRIKTKYYAVVDGDFDVEDGEGGVVNRFQWPVYHIENFLLDPNVISEVVSEFGQRIVTAEEVLEDLRDCARASVVRVVRQKVSAFVNRELVSGINLSFDPKLEDVSQALCEAVDRSVTRMNVIVQSNLTHERIEEYRDKIQREIEVSFADGSWLTSLPGREILKIYSTRLPISLGYEPFRNLIVNRMAASGIRPEGMREIMAAIEATD